MTGSHSHRLRVEAAAPRTPTQSRPILIGDQSMVITQRSATCTVSASPTSASHGSSAESGSFIINVSSGCSWTINNTNTWLSITTPTSGSGSGAAGYSVTPNSTTLV